MLSYERDLQQQGYRNIAGVDEVGRGSFAGPVVAVAVILDAAIPGVNDSKRLTPQSRERLDYEIRKKTKAVGVGVVDVSTSKFASLTKVPGATRITSNDVVAMERGLSLNRGRLFFWANKGEGQGSLPFSFHLNPTRRLPKVSFLK